MHVAELKPLGRDVEAAKALLKEAGVSTPVTVQLTVPNNPDLRQVGEIIQAMAGEAGFDVKITVTEAATLLGLCPMHKACVTAFMVRDSWYLKQAIRHALKRPMSSPK